MDSSGDRFLGDTDLPPRPTPLLNYEANGVDEDTFSSLAFYVWLAEGNSDSGPDWTDLHCDWVQYSD